MEEQHEQLKASVKRRHENEAAELQRLYEAVARLSRKEMRSFVQKYAGTQTAETVSAELLSGVKVWSEKHVVIVEYSAPVVQRLDIDAVGLAAQATMFAINSADITETGELKYEPKPEFVFSPVVQKQTEEVPVVDLSAWGLSLTMSATGNTFMPAVSFEQGGHKVQEDQRVKFEFIDSRLDI